VKALATSRSLGKTTGFGRSQLPLLHLASTNNDGDDGNGAPNETNDVDENDFIGRASKISQPTKSDLYGEDELAGLLNLHQQLQSAMAPPPTEPSPTIESPKDLFAGGLHDMILQTIEEIDDEKRDDTERQNQPWISDDDRDKISNIIAVASDVDGTIVGFDQKIHPRTRDAINAALVSKKLKWIFPATGKTRWGARNSLGSELSRLTDGPGVYVQGLYCLGENGEVVFEKKLTSPALKAAERLVADSGTAVVAYDGDSLYSTDVSKIEVIELHKKWGEPESQQVSSLSAHPHGVHKILLMDNDAKKLEQTVRPKLEELAKEYGCVVTQAVPTMLELLPFGCSKAKGVQMVCEHLGIDPASQLLTIVSLFYR